MTNIMGMMKITPGLIVLGVCLTGISADEDGDLLKQAQAEFAALPNDAGASEFPTMPERVALGRVLFFDPRLSLDGNVSCATCHQPAFYGTDALSKSIGVRQRQQPRNAPTVLNTALNPITHWRGDRKNVEDQAVQALVSPISGGNPDHSAVVAKVEAIGGYAALFKSAFPGDNEPVSAENVARAIGAYERTLMSASPFDKYLKGATQALAPTAKAGLRKFIGAGCANCHNGVNIGGGMFQRFGKVEDYWKATGSQEIDKGRVDVTTDPSDLYVFRVASLRNVAMTAPYFHDGSVATLQEAIRVMGRVQLGVRLTDEDVRHIEAFLDTLTGEVPEDFATAPTLPAGAFKRIP